MIVTLTTHAIVGAAITSVFPTQIPFALAAAFASHFLIDAIPHYDYPIRSQSVNPLVGAPMKYDKNFWLDAVTIGGDAVLGVAASLLFFASPQNFWLIFFGACAGILPDFLQFIYGRFPKEPLVSLQRFHMWIHTEHKLKNHKLAGLISQLLFLSAVIIITKII